MKFAIILPLLTSRTGPQRFVAEVAKALRAKGHEVHVYSLLYFSESTFESLRKERVNEALRWGSRPLRGLARKILETFQRKQGRLAIYVSGVSLSIFISPAITFLSLRIRPDVVIVNSGNTLMCLVKPLFRLLLGKDVKFILYYHGFLETRANTLLAKLLRPFERLSMLTCTFVTNSRDMAEEFLKATGIKPKVLNIGIDLERFAHVRRVDEGRTLLYVGRIAPYRRQDFLLEVARLLKERGEKFKLIIAGSLNPSDIEYYRKLLRKIDEFDLRDEVIIATNVSDDELLKLYSKGTVYVNPVEETYGINILEALAMGMPIIAFKKGGQLDIVRHGVEGFLTGEDPKQWAELISRLLTDKKLYNKMSKAALDRVKDFSWNNLIVKVEALLRK